MEVVADQSDADRIHAVGDGQNATRGVADISCGGVRTVADGPQIQFVGRLEADDPAAKAGPFDLQFAASRCEDDILRVRPIEL
ncbi:MAG TPA: hypothetical protein VK620_12245, partial [Bradyrhizobium sp.]|nr:hypothetical protein [Bradyrhizobium sp.]